MTRCLALLSLLGAAAAQAHTFTFDFVSPSGVGAKTDGGFTVLQWVDGPDPNMLAALTMYAARNGISPFAPAPKDVQFGPVGIPLSDPLNLVVWDATAVPPGCYQPFAMMVDQIEGTTLRPSSGIITVVPTDGGNVPPALWILNQPFERPPDGGTFGMRIKVDDPDDVGALTLRWSNGADAGGVVVAGLPTADGGGTLTYAIDLKQLPPAQTYYFQAEVKAFDGQQCAVWWNGYLPGLAAPMEADAGTDGGTDGGTPSDGGPPVAGPRGCGCSTGGAPLLALALWAWILRGRRAGCAGSSAC